jgi:hypothetical protein
MVMHWQVAAHYLDIFLVEEEDYYFVDELDQL